MSEGTCTRLSPLAGVELSVVADGGDEEHVVRVGELIELGGPRVWLGLIVDGEARGRARG